MCPCKIAWIALAGAVVFAAVAAAPLSCGPDPDTSAQSQAMNDTNPSTRQPGADADAETQVATFAAGCFWGVEETFRTLDGVVSTRVGYTGGHTDNPTYRQVCGDGTGHAEAVEVTYDPRRVSYRRLLEVFWDAHNPTTLNRQGPDFGSQYRSAVFYHDDGQRELAESARDELNASGRYDRPVVTEVAPASTFWPAEEYHQKYLLKKGGPACH